MNWRVRPLFAWYDLWVGAYWDRANHRLYVMPIPCFGFVIERRTRWTAETAGSTAEKGE